MSINKECVMAGMIATALVAPMAADATNSYADDSNLIKSSNSTSSKYVDVTAGLNVRKGPSTSYSVIRALTYGTKVEVISTSNGWSKITSGSTTGYVSNTYLSSNKPGSSNNSNNQTSVTKYVNVSAGLNVRKGPSTSYSVVKALPYGTKVTVKSTSGNWSKITSGSTTGYVSNSYLGNSKSSSGSSNDSNKETSTTKYVNPSIGVNVRKGPSASYSIVRALTYGTKVEVISTSNGWSKITSGNITGYISSSYLTSSKPSSGSNNDSNKETSTTKYVNVSAGLNMRKGPSTSYSVVKALPNGSKVTVKSTSNGWSKINSGSTTGYGSSSYLSSSKPSSGSNNDSNKETSTTKYVNTSGGLNVRKGPSTSYSVVTSLSRGTQVTVKSTSNGWSKITSGGVTGYVSSSYLSASKPSPQTPSSPNPSTSTSASKVISYGQKLLGKPYVWGAQGPNGFDCSGFTYYIFKNAAGITLPRTSSSQSQYGTYVSKSNLKPGDLVFFDTVGANNGGVTHVGIYIGNGQLMHAASGQGKVVINNLYSSYYTNAYVNARRVL